MNNVNSCESYMIEFNKPFSNQKEIKKEPKKKPLNLKNVFIGYKNNSKK